MTSRRSLLQAAAILPLLGGCDPARTNTRTNTRNYTPSGLPLRQVKVAQERVIRTVAGLRPFRSAGFVLRAERQNDKVLIHNYGHGGGGITLSWGTSHLAMELALQTSHKRCAVLGCGAVGLASARLMQDRGWEVTIYAKDLPPNTTSNIAGGQWSPASVYDNSALTPAFAIQFEQAMRHAYTYFQNLVGPKYGVRWISNYQVSGSPAPDDNLNDKYADMYPQLMNLTDKQHPFSAPHVRHYDTMLIEPAVYLPAMMQDFYGAGGDIVVREFADSAEIQTLEQPVIINCTGLGSRALFNDTELFPVKGQLSFILPQEEVNYILIGDGIYMFPRSDGILLGGTFVRNDWSLTPDPIQTNRILTEHKAFFTAMDDPWS